MAQAFYFTRMLFGILRIFSLNVLSKTETNASFISYLDVIFLAARFRWLPATAVATAKVAQRFLFLKPEQICDMCRCLLHDICDSFPGHSLIHKLTE